MNRRAGNSFLMDEECIVAFHLWKVTVAKWEFESRFEELLEPVISILLSTCEDKEWK